MYNVKTAVSRLSFAPRAKDMQVTDVKTGHFVFVPKPDRPVSREELERSVTRAGYQIEDIWIEVRGAVASGGLQASGTGQTFALAGAKAGELKAPPAGAPLVVRGRWRPGPGGGTVEVDTWKPAG